jgi:hypothetical protein
MDTERHKHTFIENGKQRGIEGHIRTERQRYTEVERYKGKPDRAKIINIRHTETQRQINRDAQMHVCGSADKDMHRQKKSHRKMQGDITHRDRETSKHTRTYIHTYINTYINT